MQHFVFPFTRQELHDALGRYLSVADTESLVNDIFREMDGNGVGAIIGLSLTPDTHNALAALSADCASRVEQYRRTGLAIRPQT